MVHNIGVYCAGKYVESEIKQDKFLLKQEDYTLMRIDGFGGRNAQTGAMGNIYATDFVGRNIQNQIANAQQKLQDLSSDEEMSLEDKMKKRQEIQQEITSLNQQLRQHQLEQRREQQSKSRASQSSTTSGAKRKASKRGAGLSQASMQALISADSSMKQAEIQGNMSTQMEGRAGVLAAEIKQDAGRGNTEKKEEELADLQAKAQSATEAQMSSLSDVNKSVEEAVKADSEAEADNRTEKDKSSKNKTGKTESAKKTDSAEKTQEDSGVKADVEDAITVESIASDSGQTKSAQTEPIHTESAQTEAGKPVYTSIDIRL